MRTTLNIDDDVLYTARKMATSEGKSLGKVISALARKSLHSAKRNSAVRNGILLLSARPGASPITPELVRQLQNEL
jgi:hypothetical protein